MEHENTSLAFDHTVHEDHSLSALDISVIIIDIVLIIVIVGGNLLTLLAVWRTPALRTVPNMFVVSLAVADLLAGIILPYQMLIFFPGMRDVFNSNVYLCLFRYCLFFVSAGESILCLLAISIDRWIYIAQPLRYVTLVTRLRARVVIGATWCLALVYGSVPFFNNKWEDNVKCRLFSVLTFEYQIYVQSGSFLIMCVVCIVAYANIFNIARKQRRSIAVTTSRDDKLRVKKAQSDWKLIQLFVLVFGVFFVCWSPTFVCLVFGHTTGIPYAIMDVVGPISVFNSGMNFFIYAYKNKEFRNAFSRLLCNSRGRKRERADITVEMFSVRGTSTRNGYDSEV